MDSDPPLEPVVIPFIHVTHRTHHYTCSQDGLKFEAYEYEDHLSGLFTTSPLPADPLLPLELWRRDGPRRVPMQVAMPKEWWKAQCAFRGLSTDGTIEELQSTIKGHEQEGMAEQIRDFEIQSIKQFRVQNADAREQMWLHEMSNEEKAESNPRRLLMEIFPAGKRNKNVIVLRMRGNKVTKSLSLLYDFDYDDDYVPPGKSLEIEDAAKALKLECDSMVAPSKKRCIVIGRTKSAVAEEVQSIQRMWQREKQRLNEVQEQHRRDAEELALQKQKERVNPSTSWNDYDVTGRWKTSCPQIDEGLDNQYFDSEDKSDLTLDIYVEETKKGPQMFAEFNFGHVSGVFRFERQEGDEREGSGKEDEADSDKDSREEDEDEVENNAEDKHEEEDEVDVEDEDEDDDDDIDGDERLTPTSPNPEAFYFGSITKPSAKYPTWNYRWRGEEQYEGVVELGSDEHVYTLTFYGRKGRQLMGNFGGVGFVKGTECTFNGVKVGMGGSTSLDIEEEWANRNEAACAPVGRWRSYLTDPDFSPYSKGRF